MPFAKVYIHFVWSTKNRKPFLSTQELRKQTWQHIKENSNEKGIHLEFINGYSDHCHCIVSLGTDQSMSKVMHLIKGESSFWINKLNLCKEKFVWPDDYYAASVSEFNLDRVREYIKNQEEHHKHKSYQDEYEELIHKNGFQKFG
jgi:putative transposase